MQRDPESGGRARDLENSKRDPDDAPIELRQVFE